MTALELRTKIAETELLIAPLQQTRYELLMQLAEMLADFKVGEIITWDQGRAKGCRKGRVTGVYLWLDKPAYRVVRVRADGTDGEKQEILFFHNPRRA